MKRNDGFTLIELLVTISAGALVTFAAVSLLLLGARVQYTTTQEAQEQQTVRIVMSLLEDMAGSGAFNEIVPVENNSWQLWNCANAGTSEHAHSADGLMFTYDAATGSIYRGAAAAGNEPLLTGLNNAIAIMEGADTNILRLSFETDRGANYVTRVYCRTVHITDRMSQNDQKDASGHAGTGQTKVNGNQRRIDFLNTLAGEYAGGQNAGKIMNDGGPWTYYSEWYIGGYADHPGWNKDTPWCACFVSWAAVKNNLVQQGGPFVFANVDAGMEAFDKAGQWTDAKPGVIPSPGDYIFFDWTGDKKDPAHVGVVLDVADTNDDEVLDTIYTIEGNSSGRVAVRKYSATDETIMGYGVLPGF